MNRLITTNLDGVRLDTLPPRTRQGPVRVLFLTTWILGFRTFGAGLEARTAARPDIDAVHIHLVAPTWMRTLGRSAPFLRGVDFHSYRFMLMWERVIGRWLRGPLAHEHFDVIHITTQNNALALLRLPPAPRPRLAIAIDATALSEARDFGYGMLDRRPIIAAERRLFRQADLIACWSSWARRSVVDDYGISPDHAAVMRVSVEIPQPTPAALAEKARTDRPLRIVFVCNDWVRKGGRRLLAWHQARWADRAELHIFSLRAPVDRAAKNVVWHGITPRDTLLTQLLPTMDLFVIPTQEDTLLWAALEAQGLGVPVIASRLAGIATDIVRDGHTGLLCDAHDDAAFIAATEQLLNDPQLRARMSAAGPEFVAAEWNADALYRRYLDRLVSLAAVG